MKTFKIFFQNLNENMIAGDGGVFGDYGGSTQDASDSHTDYAPGDTRIPKVLGGKKKKAKKNGKKTKKSTGFQYFTR